MPRLGPFGRIRTFGTNGSLFQVNPVIASYLRMYLYLDHGETRGLEDIIMSPPYIQLMIVKSFYSGPPSSLY